MPLLDSILPPKETAPVRTLLSYLMKADCDLSKIAPLDPKKKFDNILEVLGISYWNGIIFAMSAWVPGLLPTNYVGSQFINPEPSFICLQNGTELQSSCFLWHEVNNVRVGTPCTQWEYDTTVFKSTIAMEWDLICQRSYMRPMFQTTYTIGCLFGAILGGFLSERYGRRFAVRLGSLFTAISSILLAFSPTLFLVFVNRFLIGIFNTVMVYPAFILAMEVCPPKLRSTVGVMLALPYALMMVVLAVLAYFIRDWRTLQLACALPTVGLFPLTFLVDESPRWLISKGKSEKAIEILEKAASQSPFTEQKVHSLLQEVIPQLECEIRKENINTRKGLLTALTVPLEKLLSPPLRRITTALMLIWFCQAIVYLGIPLSSDSFRSPYMYMIMIGLIELPAYTVSAPVNQRLGRRNVVCGCLIICGVCILVATATQLLKFSETIMFVLYITGYLLVCTSYQVNFIYAQELLPTSLRPYGTSLLSLTAYTGFSVPPFLIDILGDLHRWVPSVVFGLCSILGGTVVLLLPETEGKVLPDTLSDAQSLLSNKRKQIAVDSV